MVSVHELANGELPQDVLQAINNQEVSLLAFETRIEMSIEKFMLMFDMTWGWLDKDIDNGRQRLAVVFFLN